jgi:hypothetical protein
MLLQQPHWKVVLRGVNITPIFRIIFILSVYLQTDRVRTLFQEVRPSVLSDCGCTVRLGQDRLSGVRASGAMRGIKGHPIPQRIVGQ